MMSFDKQPEIVEIPIAGRQVGDTNLLTSDGIVHLPDCMVFKADKANDCSCGASLAKKGEFLETGDK